MRQAFAASLVTLALVVVPVQLCAKGDTVRIMIKGGDLLEPVEITDPAVTAGFRVWSGPGTSSNEAQGLIVDWFRGVAEPPRGLRIYEVSFLTTVHDPGTYVVRYVIDPSTNHGYVYLPGRTDAEYRDNVRLILRGIEGNWFHAWSAWEQLAHPLIAKARLSPVFNSAGYTTAVAPGALVSIFFGANAASAGLSAQSLPLPTTMADTSVTFNGIAAPLLYVSGSQINAQVPFELTPGSVVVQVRRGTASASQLIEVSPAAPAIFAVNAQGHGPGAILYLSDFSVVTEDHPARTGEYLAIYCTGLGATSPSVPSGSAPPIPPPETILRPVVTIAGISAPVIYAERPPGRSHALSADSDERSCEQHGHYRRAIVASRIA